MYGFPGVSSRELISTVFPAFSDVGTPKVPVSLYFV